jgi:HK97 gp10 family phage protein
MAKLITVQGLEKLGILKTNLQHVDVKDKNARAVARAAMLVERGGKKAITGPERAIKTGALRASIVVNSLTPTSAHIGPTMSYGIYVHEGTRFMKARPFMTTGMKMEEKNITEVLKDTGLKIGKDIVKGL